MTYRSRQHGISFFGLMMGGVILGFGTLIGLKLIPVYLESFKIQKAITGIVEDPGVVNSSKVDMIHSLIRRLDIDDVRSVNEGNYQDLVKITKKDKKVIIQVQYRRETDLFGNLSAVASFDMIAEN